MGVRLLGTALSLRGLSLAAHILQTSVHVHPSVGKDCATEKKRLWGQFAQSMGLILWSL
jgi:hypothetical protein